MAEKQLTHSVLVKVMQQEGYLVFRVPSLPGESVTVSIKNWDDPDPPEAGRDAVLVGRLQSHRQGWRAKKARYLQPEDVASLPVSKQKGEQR